MLCVSFTAQLVVASKLRGRAPNRRITEAFFSSHISPCDAHFSVNELGGIFE